MTIKLNNDYKLTVLKRKTADNYTLFAKVFIKALINCPMFGTSFKENTPIEDIKRWANAKINSQTNPLNELFTYFNI